MLGNVLFDSICIWSYSVELEGSIQVLHPQGPSSQIPLQIQKTVDNWIPGFGTFKPSEDDQRVFWILQRPHVHLWPLRALWAPEHEKMQLLVSQKQEVTFPYSILRPRETCRRFSLGQNWLIVGPGDPCWVRSVDRNSWVNPVFVRTQGGMEGGGKHEQVLLWLNHYGMGFTFLYSCQKIKI